MSAVRDPSVQCTSKPELMMAALLKRPGNDVLSLGFMVKEDNNFQVRFLGSYGKFAIKVFLQLLLLALPKVIYVI